MTFNKSSAPFTEKLHNVFISDSLNPPSRSSAPITVSNYSHPELQNYTAIWMVPDDDNVEDSEDDTQSQSTDINVSVMTEDSKEYYSANRLFRYFSIHHPYLDQSAAIII